MIYIKGFNKNLIKTLALARVVFAMIVTYSLSSSVRSTTTCRSRGNGHGIICGTFDTKGGGAA
jgi:hypothetical protein